MTILIADDDRVHVQLVSSRLKKLGINVAVAFDAMQAFTLAISTAPTALLLDVNMPGGTGFEVLKRLKNSSKTNQIPVIVVSGSIDEKTSGAVKELGAEAYLPKPVDFAQLLETLYRVLGLPVETSPQTELHK
ncbi:MAG TPA: response regulator [Terriglobia bacterium]|nr:response regulator [Terriglobia bacterium]